MIIVLALALHSMRRAADVAIAFLFHACANKSDGPTSVVISDVDPLLV
jgi:hypothetical protein